MQLRTEPGRRRVTPVGFLCLYVALLYLLPGNRAVVGLGAACTPATVVGLLGLFWYLAASILPDLGARRPRNGVRRALVAYGWFLGLAWTIGKARPLTLLEQTSSDRAMITLASLLGVALLATDGLRTRRDVRLVVNTVLVCATIMTIVGSIQFFTKIDLTRFLTLPGLKVHGASFSAVPERSIFNRPFGTALHPIEYGVVTASVLPLFLARLRDVSPERRRLAVVAFGLVAFGAMTSISRSAVVASAVVLVVVLVGATWRQRLNIVGTSAAFVVAAGSVVPGLVGTLRSLFLNTSVDPSIQARIDRIPKVQALLLERPWFGRGYGTYTPEDYFLLDNEIFKTAIETGLVGIGVLVTFVGFVTLTAWRDGVTLSDRGDLAGRQLQIGLVATALGLVVSSYTFDAFFYRVLTGTLFLTVGLIGAQNRIIRSGPPPDSPDRAPQLTGVASAG